jgi:hypothetical protein
MKYIIQVKSKDEIRYLQEFKNGYDKIWLFEENKENATIFESMGQAIIKIGELIVPWGWDTYIILELGVICKGGETKATKTYETVKKISISDYN